ncbi:hypothetical protein Dvina_01950 [Dactylosporangium vinaceum]|uniref:ABC transporter permease n=1 Tax=Dactylosporangium vinaceum TaxID=53362 RepID=A0ABV5MF42_9ACTN|nr:hypothetical protein [Dactylosporangium vinaceum]UAB96999.1 hypothetical protein Dvina_01950 [Dactylosporangium vinaceum]
MTRGPWLYLRSRRVAFAVAGSAGGVALVTAAWSGLMSRADVPAGLAVLTAAMAAAPFGSTLAGPDPALDRTAALPWPPRRGAHLLACGLVVAALLLAARPFGADFGPAWVVLRNAAGLTGLIGLGAAVAGARAAWPAPVAWAAFAAFLPAPGGPRWRQAALWMVQDPSSRVAALTAVVLLLAGVAAYAVRVGPQVAPVEAAMDQ